MLAQGNSSSALGCGVCVCVCVCVWVLGNAASCLFDNHSSNSSSRLQNLEHWMQLGYQVTHDSLHLSHCHVRDSLDQESVATKNEFPLPCKSRAVLKGNAFFRVASGFVCLDRFEPTNWIIS